MSQQFNRRKHNETVFKIQLFVSDVKNKTIYLINIFNKLQFDHFVTKVIVSDLGSRVMDTLLKHKLTARQPDRQTDR